MDVLSAQSGAIFRLRIFALNIGVSTYRANRFNSIALDLLLSAKESAFGDGSREMQRCAPATLTGAPNPPALQ